MNGASCRPSSFAVAMKNSIPLRALRGHRSFPFLIALLAGGLTVASATTRAASEPSPAAVAGAESSERSQSVPAVASASAPKAGATAAAAAVPAGGLRPFADVIKDAKRIDGLLTLWQKDERVWIELRPGDLDVPFFLSPKTKTGIGEGRFYGGLMGEEIVI